MSAIIELSERLHTEGVASLNKGEIQLFPGLSQMVQTIPDRFIFALDFGLPTNISNKYGISTLLDQMERFEYSNKFFGFFLAGRQYPIHSTIAQAKYVGGDSMPGSHHFVFDRLKTDPRMRDYFLQLLGTRIIFDTLVLNKSDIMLTASEIPDKILKVREELNELFSEYKLLPLKIENLLHITVGRICRVDKDKAQQQLQLFVKVFSSLKEYIKTYPFVMAPRGPLVMPTAQIFIGTKDISDTTWAELTAMCPFECSLSGWTGPEGDEYKGYLEEWEKGEGEWKEGLLTAELIHPGIIFSHPGFGWEKGSLLVEFNKLHKQAGKTYAKIRVRT